MYFLLRLYGAALVVVVALAGCVKTAPMYGPDGQQYTHISCSGGIDSMADCYNKAMEVCPQGYYLADRQYNAVPVSVFNLNADPYRAQGAGIGMMSEDRSIIVKCR